jgi:hypothetical protein
VEFGVNGMEMARELDLGRLALWLLLLASAAEPNFRPSPFETKNASITFVIHRISVWRLAGAKLRVHCVPLINPKP